MLKVQEETGEVAEAYIGFLGLNPRKGVTHTPYEVSMELADIVITALVAIVMMGFSPDEVLAHQMIKAEDRLNEAADSEQGV
jgi:phosphoribosyl-ATP pyrophosphohydrolase